MRLRLTAHAVAGLPRACAKADPAFSDAVAQRTDAIVSWYEQLALCVGRPGRESRPIFGPGLRGDGEAGVGPRATIWLREHLDHLVDHLHDLVRPANHLAEVRRRPWWQ